MHVQFSDKTSIIQICFSYGSYLHYEGGRKLSLLAKKPLLDLRALIRVYY